MLEINHFEKDVVENEYETEEEPQAVLITRKIDNVPHKALRKLHVRYKDGEEKVRVISIKYNAAFQALLNKGEKNLSRFVLFDSHGNSTDFRETMRHLDKTDSPSVNYIASVDIALMALGKERSMILYNDFFFPTEQKWWFRFYSRSAYYRLKKEAVQTFLKIFGLWEE